MTSKYRLSAGPSIKAAYVYASASRALIKAMAMLSENLQRYMDEESIAYPEEAFEALEAEFNIDDDALLRLMSGGDV